MITLTQMIAALAALLLAIFATDVADHPDGMPHRAPSEITERADSHQDRCGDRGPVTSPPGSARC